MATITATEFKIVSSQDRRAWVIRAVEGDREWTIAGPLDLYYACRMREKLERGEIE